MRVAVVGAGVYGSAIAIDLARAGHQVDLYERHRDLLHGATRANQGRLHSGYHYPRSFPTAQAARDDAERFRTRFPGVLYESGRHYYAIASQGSRTSAEAYRAVLPGVDATDERPTLIHRDGRIVHVLAGKVDGAVDAAKRVTELASSMVATG